MLRRRSWLDLLPRDAALNLAVFRIAVGFLLLTVREIGTAASWANLPAALATTPRGWGWALAIVPVSPAIARGAQVALVVGALFGALGCFARVAFGCATVAALYLLALPLRSGMPYHYQHLVWFTALLAASPCADALSLDAWWRRRARGRGENRRNAGGAPALPPGRAPAYGVPIRIAWLLLGMVFFFPGFWKLRSAGLGWITGDTLRDQMYWKWAVIPGLTPPLRIDRFPRLLHAAAAGVVLLELGFVFAVWRRWSRIVAVGAALLFHALARAFMGIDFSGLWLAYVVFVDWDALFRRATADGAEPAAGAPEAVVRLSRVAPALTVGLVLLAGAAEAGARGATTGWPFACYPTFAEATGTEMPALVLVLVGPDGAESPVGMDALADAVDRARERAFGLRLLAAGAGPEQFAAYWARVSTRAALRARSPNARAVRFYAGRISTVPEERDRPPVARRLTYELALEPASTMMPRARSGATTWSASDDAARRK
jgi:hypothetical protein